MTIVNADGRCPMWHEKPGQEKEIHKLQKQIEKLKDTITCSCKFLTLKRVALPCTNCKIIEEIENEQNTNS